jgi:hypothetical protein
MENEDKIKINAEIKLKELNKIKKQYKRILRSPLYEVRQMDKKRVDKQDQE